MPQGGEPEQRVDRGQAGVAGADAVAAFVFEVVEERADQGGVQIGEVRAPRARLPVCSRGEAEQQPQRVAVGGDGVRAGVPLADQPVGEERLQGRGERGHGRADRPAGCLRGGFESLRRRWPAAPGRRTGTSR